ncbi:MAG TPA: hypothetical protein VJH92_04695 [Candidatus Nanoarchaeia archaeon]|nr:hypothetical protein [Candidatus Nanoarchaeia archaeon]
MAGKLQELYVSDEKIGEKVAQLYEKVLHNRGEVMLTFRRVYLGTEPSSGDMIPPESYHGDAFETGVIDGEMVKGSAAGALSFWATRCSNFPIIYYLMPDLLVPVKNKLEWHDSKNEFQRDMIDFPPRDLKDAKDGNILISSYELLERDDLCETLYPHTPPYLKKLEVLIGDDDIMNFAKPFIDGHHLKEENVRDFLHLMKTPGEIERMVEEGYIKERESLVWDLVRHVSNLNGFYRRALGMEERVLRLSVDEVMEQRGVERCVSDGETYTSYIDLSKQINASLKTINGLLDNGVKISLEKHPSMKGDAIGFPAEISTKDYLKYIQKDLLPKTKEILDKLGRHVGNLKF